MPVRGHRRAWASAAAPGRPAPARGDRRMSYPSLPPQMVRRWRRVVFRLNTPLILGGVLAGLMVICAIAAPLIAPFDPYDAKVVFDEGGMVRMPYPPGAHGMLLGSDSIGRDLLSRLIFGSRYTLLFC